LNEKPTFFLSAGEASGDEHAANLIRALRRRLPEARFVGVAGKKMAAEGCDVVEDVTRKASMLLGPVFNLAYYLRKLHRIKKAIAQIRPDIHIPVDAPALNWHLAAAARKAGASVVHYISPQVWAWAPWRVKKLARLTDHVACILPFEQEYLRQRGVPATYVGHPLLDALPPRTGDFPDLLDAWTTGEFRVAMLPGSRTSEIAGHSSALLATAETIQARWPKAHCFFAARTERCARDLHKALKKKLPSQSDIVVGQTREILERSHFAVAVSGTVTLEAAYYGVPMVVFYHTGRLQYAIGRWLIRTPYLSLVNILAKRRIVPEIMPWHGSKKQIASAALEMMNEIGYLVEARRDLLGVIEPLKLPPPQTASDNAAEIVINVLNSRP
jgi:lipid-A-disaccharide synthase